MKRLALLLAFVSLVGAGIACTQETRDDIRHGAEITAKTAAAGAAITAPFAPPISAILTGVSSVASIVAWALERRKSAGMLDAIVPQIDKLPEKVTIDGHDVPLREVVKKGIEVRSILRGVEPSLRREVKKRAGSK